MLPITAEERAREHIDDLLTTSGWHIFNVGEANIITGQGVAIRECPLPDHSFADYLLYVDSKATGVIEAKRRGVTLTGIETQSDKYTKGLPDSLPR